MKNECEIVASAMTGERNNQLFRSAAALGGLIAGGELDELTARAGLLAACYTNGLVTSDGSTSVRKTIESGISTGRQTARTAPASGAVSTTRTSLVRATNKLVEQQLQWPCTELGNAERFVHRHGHHVAYVPGFGWFAHNGSRWAKDEALFTALVVDTVRSIGEEIKACNVEASRHLLNRWVPRSESNAGKNAMLELAQGMLVAKLEHFDTDKSLLNCQNGAVDLRTGQLTDHDPSQMFMKQAPVHYDPRATYPVWNKFLNDVLVADQKYISYLQKVLGYAVTGETNEQVFFLAYGRGSNGKTTLFETAMKVIGDYSCTVEFDTFLAADKSSVRTLEAIGNLKGKRLALASETGSSRKFSEAIVKKVSGGDTLTGAGMYAKSFEFLPTHTLFFAVNHLPGFKDGSHGMKRRIVVLPFAAKFDGESLDKHIYQKLWDEREGILAWLVEGAKRYYKEGLGEPPNVVKDAIDEYIEDNDTMGRFISDCTIPSPGANVTNDILYHVYEIWARQQGEFPTDKRYFRRTLEERGLESQRGRNGHRYKHITLSEAGSSLLGYDP